MGSKVVLLLSLCFLLTSCFVKGSITDFDPKSVIQNKTSSAEIVSGSTQSVKTGNGYLVQSSSGQPVNKLEVTTDKGYKVIQTVQGNISLDSKAK